MLHLLAAHRVPRNELYGVALLYLPLTAEAARIAAAEQAAADAKAAEEAAAAVALAAEAELAKASLDRPELKAAAKAELYDSGDEDTGGDNAEEAVRFTQLDCAYIILRTCRSYSIFLYILLVLPTLLSSSSHCTSLIGKYGPLTYSP